LNGTKLKKGDQVEVSDTAMFYGDNLERLVDNTGLSKREFATRAGISASHLYRLLKSDQPPSAKTRVRLQRTLTIFPDKETTNNSSVLVGEKDLPYHKLVVFTTASTYEEVGLKLFDRARELGRLDPVAMELRRQARRLFIDAAFWYEAAGDHPHKEEMLSLSNKTKTAG
jgi:transcriptional regulator with XRE-family HTH domain